MVALGVVLTVLSFCAYDTWTIGRYWPMLVVGFGVTRIVEPSSHLPGWVLLTVGGAVQLSNLGLFVLPGREVVRYWPLAVLLVGVWELVAFRNIGTKVEGLAVMFLGIWLQLSYFGAAHISSYRPWPLVLAAIGLVMVWRTRRLGLL